MNLKILGLAFIAALAVSAVGASAAQALPQYTCSVYPCTATGSNTPGSETFTTPGGSVQCSSHYLVEEAGATGTDIHGARSTATVTASYTDCIAFGFLGSTINMNGCDYVFHTAARLAVGLYSNSLSIACPAGKAITIITATCEVDIPAQSNLNTIETENLPGGTLTVRPNIANITMNVTKDGFGCPYPGTGHFKGSFHGDLVLSRVGGGSISVSGE